MSICELHLEMCLSEDRKKIPLIFAEEGIPLPFSSPEMVSLKFENGATYVGEVNLGRRCGLGVMHEEGGLLIIGQWLDDAASGVGIILFPNHEMYSGQILRGSRHGVGIHCGAERVYVGEWRNGTVEGIGVELLFDGIDQSAAVDKSCSVTVHSIYYGEWSSGERSGWGNVYFPKTGNHYQGMWEGGKMNGYGQNIWFNDPLTVRNEEDNENKNGKQILLPQIYFGEWKEGVPHGIGELVTFDSPFLGTRNVPYDLCNIYKGNMRYGKIEGHGTQWYADGSRFTGEWANSERCKGTFIDPDGCEWSCSGVRPKGSYTSSENWLTYGELGIDIADLCVNNKIEQIRLKETLIQYRPMLRHLYATYARVWTADSFQATLQRTVDCDNQIPNPRFLTHPLIDTMDISCSWLSRFDRNMWFCEMLTKRCMGACVIAANSALSKAKYLLKKLKYSVPYEYKSYFDLMHSSETVYGLIHHFCLVENILKTAFDSASSFNTQSYISHSHFITRSQLLVLLDNCLAGDVFFQHYKINDIIEPAFQLRLPQCNICAASVASVRYQDNLEKEISFSVFSECILRVAIAKIREESYWNNLCFTEGCSIADRVQHFIEFYLEPLSLALRVIDSTGILQGLGVDPCNFIPSAWFPSEKWISATLRLLATTINRSKFLKDIHQRALSKERIGSTLTASFIDRYMPQKETVQEMNIGSDTDIFLSESICPSADQSCVFEREDQMSDSALQKKNSDKKGSFKDVNLSLDELLELRAYIKSIGSILKCRKNSIKTPMANNDAACDGWEAKITCDRGFDLETTKKHSRSGIRIFTIECSNKKLVDLSQYDFNFFISVFKKYENLLNFSTTLESGEKTVENLKQLFKKYVSYIIIVKTNGKTQFGGIIHPNYLHSMETCVCKIIFDPLSIQSKFFYASKNNIILFLLISIRFGYFPEELLKLIRRNVLILSFIFEKIQGRKMGLVSLSDLLLLLINAGVINEGVHHKEKRSNELTKKCQINRMTSISRNAFPVNANKKGRRKEFFVRQKIQPKGKKTLTEIKKLSGSNIDAEKTKANPDFSCYFKEHCCTTDHPVEQCLDKPYRVSIVEDYNKFYNLKEENIAFRLLDSREIFLLLISFFYQSEFLGDNKSLKTKELSFCKPAKIPKDEIIKKIYQLKPELVTYLNKLSIYLQNHYKHTKKMLPKILDMKKQQGITIAEQILLSFDEFIKVLTFICAILTLENFIFQENNSADYFYETLMDNFKRVTTLLQKHKILI